LPAARAVVPAPDGGYPNGNTAEGTDALFSLTTGFFNTANGAFALLSNTDGSANTANGLSALESNTLGSNNTANGAFALESNTTGNHNAAYGWMALVNNANGNLNIALGDEAGVRLRKGDNNIDIGTVGIADELNTIRIGTEVATTSAIVHPAHTATFIAGISGTTIPKGVPVFVDDTGHLGTKASSARFKQNIKPMDKASEAILALKPVTFRYKQEIDQEGIPQFGLVAEEVEKVNPDLVARDAKGGVYTVRYEAVNAMLLNEFLKEHGEVQELKSAAAKQETKIATQEATIAQQQAEIKAVTAALKEQAAQIQKVNAQLELSKPATRTVLNNQ